MQKLWAYYSAGRYTIKEDYDRIKWTNGAVGDEDLGKDYTEAEKQFYSG